MELFYLPGDARIKIDKIEGRPDFVALDVIDQQGNNAKLVLTCDQADKVGRELSVYSVVLRRRHQEG